MKTTLRRLVALVLMLALCPVAYADKEKAKELFKKGMTQYKLEHYDEAIAEFEAAYAEEQSPVLLFNIAQAHRLARRPRIALNFYRKYLRDLPEAPNRDQVEKEIAGLEEDVKRLDTEEAERRQREAEAQRAAQQAAVPAAPAPPPVAEKPRWPLWVGIGAGALAVVGGAVALGVVLAQPQTPSLGLESAR